MSRLRGLQRATKRPEKPRSRRLGMGVCLGLCLAQAIAVNGRDLSCLSPRLSRDSCPTLPSPFLLSLRLATGRLGSHTCYHFIQCKAVSSSFRRHNVEAMAARARSSYSRFSPLSISAWLLLFPRAFSLGPRLKTGKTACGPVLFLARSREEERMIPRATKIEPKKAKGGPFSHRRWLHLPGPAPTSFRPSDASRFVYAPVADSRFLPVLEPKTRSFSGSTAVIVPPLLAELSSGILLACFPLLLRIVLLKWGGIDHATKWNGPDDLQWQIGYVHGCYSALSVIEGVPAVQLARTRQVSGPTCTAL